MTCPVCGAEMESGTMYTEKYPYWTQQENLPVLRTPKDMVRFRPVGDDSAGGFAFPFHDYPETMLCKACKTVVFRYN